MKAGISPREIFAALNIGPAYMDAVAKLFNPDQPRVPAGSGRTSGQWTLDAGSDEPATTAPSAPTASQGAAGGRALAFEGSLPAAAGRSAPSIFARLSSAAAAPLGEYAAAILLRAGGAAAAFGLLFIPSPNMIKVPEVPGLRYSWSRDETLLRLTYDGPNGSRQTFTAQLQGDVFRDQRGQVVGRVLPGGNIALDPAAIFPKLANDNNPRLCPYPGPDKPGELGRDYADYVKSIVNPGFPTPRYWGYQLPNPYDGGKLVNYDDCQHSTGTMVEAKGPGYVELLKYGFVQQEWVDESGRQVDASAGRPIRWYFAELGAALAAQKLFREADNGRDRIMIVWLPWTGKKQ
jgi:hypothetical protein